MTLAIDAEAVIADLDELAARSGGRHAGAKRLAWSPEWMATREWFAEKVAQLGGVALERDVAGNVWATLQGADPDAGFVIVGSHLDAVPSGGWLDGCLGVLAALGVVRALHAAGEPPPVTVKLVDWADEEGARYGRSLVGSSACAGTLDPDDVRELVDATGVRQQDAMAQCGIDVDAAAAQARASLEGALAYLELHIEQGPVLLDAGRLASAVSGTFGDERHLVNFTGQAAHAGSTPMRLRRDTLAAAATAALEIREVGIRHGGVCTVGQMRSTPGVITAVAGTTEMQLDQRHLDPDALVVMVAEAKEACHRAAATFDCEVEIVRVFGATPTPFDPRFIASARAAIEACGGGDGEPIPSGPLHDATEIGRIVPAVMIFAQSDPGLSHTEIEDSPVDALRVAIESYGRTVGDVLELAAAGELTPYAVAG